MLAALIRGAITGVRAPAIGRSSERPDRSAPEAARLHGLSFPGNRRIVWVGNCCVVPAFGEAHQWAKAHFLVCVGGQTVNIQQLADDMAFNQGLVRGIAERVAASSGLEVVDVEMRGGGKARMLRVFLDKSGGITHEDCASFSREFGTILDVEDAVGGGSYVLEVSSPGLDRKLTCPADYERFVGSRVKLTTREPVSGNRHFEGRLESIREGRPTLDLSAARRKHRPAAKAQPKLEVEFANVEKANLVPEI